MRTMQTMRTMRRTRSSRGILAGESLERRACPAAFTLTPVIDTVTEGEVAEFRVALDAPSALPQTVLISLENGTATKDVDFTDSSEELVFLPGETDKTFQVHTLSDPGHQVEGTETLTVYVTPQAGSAERVSAGITIHDAVDPSPYNIAFEFAVSVPSSVQSLFHAAASLWERAIVGDLPDVTLADGSVVDDLLIQVDMTDLGSNVIALAGFTDIRIGNTNAPAGGDLSQAGLPYLGQMTVNAAFQTAVGLGTTIAHEIGHVIGFGTLWQNGVGEFADLVAGIGTNDPVFVGENAVREFSQLFGTAQNGVPLFEHNVSGFTGYDGSYGSHWRDSVFNDYPSHGELMTAAYPIDGDGHGRACPALLSRVTIAAMDDLGYTVNYLAAESYVPPGGAGDTADGADEQLPPDLADVLRDQLTGGSVMGPTLREAPVTGWSEPRSLPPRIDHPNAAPVILADTAEARELVRISLASNETGEPAPLDLAHLTAEHLARLAAWAAFEREILWERPSETAGVGNATDDYGDGLFADPGLA
jgi:hypothetical protein